MGSPSRLGAALFLLGTLLGTAGAPAQGAEAQDLTSLSIEELMDVEVATVVSASKYEQKVTEAPASVSIVTADEIRKYGYRTLAEALQSVRGIYLSYDRNYHFLGVRGFSRPGDYNTRVLMLVDGHRINDNIFDTAPIGTEFPIDIDLVDRIEVIRGPSSSLYGTNAFFGVINVITRHGSDLKGTEIAGAGGTFASNGRVSYGREAGNGVAFLLSASGMRSDGARRLFYREFADPSLQNGVAEDLDGDRNYQLFGKVSWRDFTLLGAYSRRTKEIPTASFGTVFGLPGNATTDAHGFADLRYQHDVGEGELTARLFYDRYYYHGDYLFDKNNPDNTLPPVNPDLVPNKDLAWGTWWGAEVQYTRTFFETHKVSVGTEYRDNLRQEQKNYDVVPFQLNLDDRRHSSIWAVYGQDDMQLLKNLILSAGIRYDRYDTFGGAVNPRLGLIYEPIPGTVGKLLYGEAFRAPNAYELFYADGSSQVANTALKPEKIKTYELIYEQYFREHYRSSISGFYYRIRDLITLVDIGDGVSQYQNVDAVNAHGVEVELEGKWKGGLAARGSYTWQRAEDAGTGKILTNSPEHLAKVNLTVPLFRELLFAGIEEQYGGSRTTLAGNRTAASYLTNLTLLSRGVAPGLELSVSVYNVFNSRYFVPGSPNHVQDSIAQDGRTFRAKLQLLF